MLLDERDVVKTFPGQYLNRFPESSFNEAAAIQSSSSSQCGVGARPILSNTSC